jgi:hypothetical protein
MASSRTYISMSDVESCRFLHATSPNPSSDKPGTVQGGLASSAVEIRRGYGATDDKACMVCCTLEQY